MADPPAICTASTVPQADLEKAVVTAETRANKPILLRDVRWTRGTCEIDADGDDNKVLDGEVAGSDWYDESWAKIIAPGRRRRCVKCAEVASTVRALERAFCGFCHLKRILGYPKIETRLGQ